MKGTALSWIFLNTIYLHIKQPRTWSAARKNRPYTKSPSKLPLLVFHCGIDTLFALDRALIRHAFRSSSHKQESFFYLDLRRHRRRFPRFRLLRRDSFWSKLICGSLFWQWFGRRKLCPSHDPQYLGMLACPYLTCLGLTTSRYIDSRSTSWQTKIRLLEFSLSTDMLHQKYCSKATSRKLTEHQANCTEREIYIWSMTSRIYS